jgi:hypothetical protein
MRKIVIDNSNKDALEKVKFEHYDGTQSEGYVVTDKEKFEKSQKEKAQKRKDNLYMIFLGFGILSFALGSYASYLRLKGKN